MLNSMNLSNGHYSMKIKSMLDLALASSSQRETISPTSAHSGYPINYPAALGTNSHARQHHHHPLLHHHHHHHFSESSANFQEQQQQPVNILQNKLQSPFEKIGKGGEVRMEELNSGSRGGLSNSESHLMYPRSPSESSPKSNSPVGSGGGSRTMSPTYNNNNLVNVGTGSPSQNMQGDIVNEEGKSTMGKEGHHKHGSKTSFSIDALLAHSSNWRRQHGQNSLAQNQGGRNGGKECSNVKDNRYFPYHISPQYHTALQSTQNSQQQQQQHHSNRLHVRHASGDIGGSVAPTGSNKAMAADGEKAKESFGTKQQGGGAATGGRRPTKSKRVRTIFTPEQLERLEAEFERQQYMVGPERLYLASSLYLTEAQVKVWFQNRRIKWRKQHLELEQQRLAIYRTLAEQDMMASVEGEDDEEDGAEGSPDCDYEGEGSDGQEENQLQRNSHSPSGYHQQHPNFQHSYSTSNSSPDASHSHPLPSIHSNPPVSSLRNSSSSSFKRSTQSKSHGKSQQDQQQHAYQHIGNEEHHHPGSSPSAASSPPSSCGSFRPPLSSSNPSTKEDFSHATAVQGVKN